MHQELEKAKNTYLVGRLDRDVGRQVREVGPGVCDPGAARDVGLGLDIHDLVSFQTNNGDCVEGRAVVLQVRLRTLEELNLRLC